MSKRYQQLLSPNHIIRKEMKAARPSLLPPAIQKTEINGVVLKFLLVEQEGTDCNIYW